MKEVVIQMTEEGRMQVTANINSPWEVKLLLLQAVEAMEKQVTEKSVIEVVRRPGMRIGR